MAGVAASSPATRVAEASRGLVSMVGAKFSKSGTMRGIARLICGFLQARDVDLRHLHQGLHHALRLLGIGILQEPRQNGRDDLPRQAELVLEPSALRRSATGGELVPVVVDLLLRFAMDDEGHSFRERKLRTAIERGEIQSFELKVGG